MFRPKKLLVLLSVLAIASMLVSACAPAATTPAPTAPATNAPEPPTRAPTAPPTKTVEATQPAEPRPAPSAPKSKDPTTFTQLSFGDPETLDPGFDYESAGSNVLQNIYEGLITFDGPALTKFAPSLAESIPEAEKTTDGGVQYTWKISKGVKFHDGKDLTAEDVAYSLWRTMLQSDPNAPGFLLSEAFLGIDDVTELVAPDQSLVGDPEALKKADPKKLVAACEKVKATATFDNATSTVVTKLVHPWGPFRATLAGGPWAAVLSKQWGVENGLHYRRDETLREDWCHLKGGHAPRAMAVINNLIVGLVLHLKWTNLAEARRHYDAHPREAQHLVMRRLL